jgi:thioredoxin reductase
MQKVWDAVVIGAGPAGASCAVWLRHLGFEPLLIEASERIGGLAARNPFADVWTLTSPDQTGVEVAAQMARQVQAAGVEVWFDTAVESVSGAMPEFHVRLQRLSQPPQVVLAKTVVLASGVKPRGLPGYAGASFEGVIVGPGDAIMSASFEGLNVAILGGGDNAFENYEFVKSRGASTAHIYARTVRAQKQFLVRVPAPDLSVGEFSVDPAARRVNQSTYDLILVFYGWQPNTGFLGELPVEFDNRGFVQTDAISAQTTVDGVYAIGEIAQRMHPCVPTAMADGVVAAKAIERRLSEI